MNVPVDTFASGCAVTRAQAVPGPQSAKRVKVSPMTPVRLMGNTPGFWIEPFAVVTKGLRCSARTTAWMDRIAIRHHPWLYAKRSNRSDISVGNIPVYVGGRRIESLSGSFRRYCVSRVSPDAREKRRNAGPTNLNGDHRIHSEGCG